MSKVANQRLQSAVKFWASEGYKASAIGLMYEASENTVRRVGYQVGVIKFGDNDLPAAWVKRLTAQPEIPPNLENLYARFRWHFDKCPKMDFDLLTKLLPPMNPERLQGWWWLETERLATRTKMLVWRNRVVKNSGLREF